MDVQDARELLQQKLRAKRDELRPLLVSYRETAEKQIHNAIENLDRECVVLIDFAEDWNSRQFFAEMLAIKFQADGFSATIRSCHTTNRVVVIISGW